MSIQVKNRFLTFLLFSALSFSACVSYHPVVKYEASVIETSSSTVVKEDSILAKQIAPYKSEMNKEMSQVLAVSERAMMKDMPEGLLGNFSADAVLKVSRSICKDSCAVDICVLNNGGLRAPLPEGNITRYDVFSLMPFENEIILLTMNGDAVKELLDFIANKGGMPVSGVRMKIQNQMAVEVFIGDMEFNPEKSYSVVTSDYLAYGGDNMTFFASASRKINLNKKIRDAIIEYLSQENKNGNKINVKKDGRIQHYK